MQGVGVTTGTVMVLFIAGCLGNGSPAPLADDDPGAHSGEVRAVIIDPTGDALSPPPAEPLDDVAAARATAPPAQDVVSIGIVETPAFLAVHIVLAGVPASLEGFNDVDQSRTIYKVCWVAGDVPSGTQYCLAVFTYRIDGEQTLQAFVETYSEACSVYGYCGSGIPVEVQPGSPGALVLQVPRAFMLHAGQGQELRQFMFEVRHQSPVTASLTAGGGPNTVAVVDDSGNAETMDVRLYTSVNEPDPEVLRALSDPAHDVYYFGGLPQLLPIEYRPDLDLLDAEILENGTGFRLRTTLAAVDETPRDHFLGFPIGFSGGSMIEASLFSRGGTRELQVRYCPDVACQNPTSISPHLEVAVGTPGWIQLEFDGDELAVQKGEFTALMEVETRFEEEVACNPTCAQYSRDFFVAPPHRLVLGA